MSTKEQCKLLKAKQNMETIIKMKTILLYVLFMISTIAPALSQEASDEAVIIDGKYQLDLLFYRNNISRTELNNLKRVGWQVNDFNPLSLEIINANRLLRILHSSPAKLVLQLPNDLSFELTKNDIKLQLLEKQLPSIKSASFLFKQLQLWKYREELKGAKETDFTLSNTIAFDVAIDDAERNLTSFSLYLIDKKDTLAYYDFNRVEGAHQEALPKYVNSDCEPFTRETLFTRYQNAYKRPPLPIRFNPDRFKRIHRTFTIYFDQNSSFYPDEQLNPLKEFLSHSDYELKKFQIYSYSSVEGDSAVNLNLMKERGAILKRIVKELPYKISEIESFEAENWTLFEEQIEKDQLPNHSNAEWKEAFKNDSVLQSLASLLKKQRYAKIELYLEKEKTKEELATEIEKINDQLTASFKLWFKNKRRTGQYLHLDLTDEKLVQITRKMVGLLYFAAEESIEQETFLNKYRELPSSRFLGDEIMIYLFYQPEKFHLDIPSDRHLLNVFNSARDRIVQMPNNAANHQLFYDVQKVIFSQVESGKITSNIMYEMSYPDHLNIDPYYMLYLKRKAAFIEAGILQPEIEEGLATQPDIDDATKLLKSEYYRFLKGLVVKNTLDLLPNASVSRTDWYLPFDQYDFLWYQNNYWDAKNTMRLDTAISIKTQYEILQKLLKKPGNLCRYSLEHLAVDFYHKLLIHAEVNELPIYIDEALDYLMNYYKKNNKYVSAEDIKQISSEFYTINRFLHYTQIKEWKKEVKKINQ